LLFHPAILVAAIAVLFSCAAYGQPQASTGSPGDSGNQACQGCHAAIAESYSQTAMARASGRAAGGFIPGDFQHRVSGIHYRVFRDDAGLWFSFDRQSPPLHGKRKLLYYIGSGQRGRTYLFSQDGFLFELPVNWYGQKAVWDMTPAYQDARHMPVLPALPSCLNCHTSGMQAPIAGTENKYPDPPFAHGGVTCQRCHGAGADHLATSGKAPIINPSKLPPERRDDICMQCHLEGRIAIERAGRHAYEFRPGDRLPDYVRYFELQNVASSELGALSHVEALSQSVCKRSSGSRMSCTSCHDPHSWPAPAEKVAYYRDKCLDCHGRAFAAKHQRGNPDCISCHMPAGATRDVVHAQVTDHRILRYPGPQPVLTDLDPRSPTAQPRLTSFPLTAGEPGVRELALAWAALVRGGNQQFTEKAHDLLTQAVAQDPSDPALDSALGFMEQKAENTAKAKLLYERALRSDAAQIDAAVNLGVIAAQTGDLARALELWQDAFRRAPWHSAIGMNLARVSCSMGKIKEARAALEHVLQFNPDLGEARELLQRLDQRQPKCEP
jgi:predicted CXXCH cytochrome family protein